METIKLKRPIKDVTGKNDITEISVKSEDEMSASDFYGIKMLSDGTSELGAMADPIANLTGLTSGQVAEMHPSDFIKISGIVGKYLE